MPDVIRDLRFLSLMWPIDYTLHAVLCMLGALIWARIRVTRNSESPFGRTAFVIGIWGLACLSLRAVLIGAEEGFLMAIGGGGIQPAYEWVFVVNLILLTALVPAAAWELQRVSMLSKRDCLVAGWVAGAGPDLLLLALFASYRWLGYSLFFG